jgi:hypothetical protein
MNNNEAEPKLIPSQLYGTSKYNPGTMLFKNSSAASMSIKAMVGSLTGRCMDRLKELYKIHIYI